MSHIAYIGLGANLVEPKAQLVSAVAALQRIARTSLEAVSPLYGSKPVGPQDQPDYLNAAARLNTALTPHELLQALQGIENDHGRTRSIRWGARTLDLDVLLFAHDEINTLDLVVPHPELINRSFVVQPLLALNESLQLPNGLVLRTLDAASTTDGLVVLEQGQWW